MDRLDRLIRECRSLKQDLARDRPFRLGPGQAGPRVPAGGQDAALQEMADALKALADAEAFPFDADPPPQEPLFRPDAFRNPAHLKFALRTVLAAMACYAFYTAVDWPGIHTAMLTCIILAIPPLGMSSLGGIAHKGLVRVLGAALGSSMALFATVFILPRLDGITGLLSMILPVIALAGWITAGSSKSNYVGRQLMFTYVLALLGRFTLYPDIPEIRDRIVGILVGVVVYLTLAAFVWPDRERGVLAGHAWPDDAKPRQPGPDRAGARSDGAGAAPGGPVQAGMLGAPAPEPGPPGAGGPGARPDRCP